MRKTISETKDVQIPAVSIIIPVYNAENTLNRCIDSVLKQSYENFELILVNDGSSDTSGLICDEYAAKDGRVHVIHKNNSGVSDSRNTALALARGAYIQFIDADDWIAPEATGLLMDAAAAHDCDMVISDFYRVVDDRLAHKGDIQEEGLLSRQEFASCMMEKPADFYYGVLWNKLYKKELIDRHQLHMDSRINWCEDFMFNLEYICHSRNIYVLRVPIYYYVRTRHSLSSQGASITKAIQMKVTVFEYYNKFYKEVFCEEDNGKSRLQVYRFLMDAASDGIVPPALPGTLKLGEERVQVNPAVFEKQDILSDIYLKKKCLEACLQAVAFRYDLRIDEANLLLCTYQSSELRTRKELADLLGCSRRKVSRALQNLKNRGYLIWTEPKIQKKGLAIRLLPDASPIVESLENARNTCLEICYAGFTDEEKAMYDGMAERMKENILRILS